MWILMIMNTIIQLNILALCFFIQRDTKYKFGPRLIMIMSIILMIVGFTQIHI